MSLAHARAEDELAITGASGVQLAGLGIDLDLWDRLAASLPPDARPSTRGAWSGAIERAYVLQQAGRTLGARPDGATIRRSAAARMEAIRSALTAGPKTATELAAITGDSIDAVRNGIHVLISRGEIAGLEQYIRNARRPGSPQRYQLTPRGHATEAGL